MENHRLYNKVLQDTIYNIAYYLTLQLGLNWRLSKEQCEGANLREYVSKHDLSVMPLTLNNRYC